MGSGTDPNKANIAKVKFTVRTAGQYKISVMIGSNHIGGSPFTRTFVPGPIDARRSRLVRPASTVVCCAGAATMLHIEPRDKYGNVCVFEADDEPSQVSKTRRSISKLSNSCNINFVYIFPYRYQGYKAEVYTLNDVFDEKLSGAITLAYDKVNARVSVTALFPEPICLKANILYNNQRLPNGDFDIIVLSSK